MNEKTWVLTNRWCNFCYLLLGDQEALLIDTGCGEENVRELDRKILRNTAKLQESLVGFGWPAEVDEDSDIAACYPAFRAQYGKASIVYR